MLRKKVVVGSIFFLLLVALAFLPKPVPQASPENTVRTYGIIEEVSESQHSGILLKLRGDDRVYYIHDAQTPQLQLTSLEKVLPGQIAEIYYLKHWTAADLLMKRKQVARMQVNKTTLYSTFGNQ